MRVSVDIGGTFTDCVVETDGVAHTVKVPTTPDDPVRGVLDAIRRAAGEESIEAFVGRVDQLIHGTTLATNVLLAKRGAKTGLITTDGFRDVIHIRRGIRNLGVSMFDQFRPPYEPLVPRSLRLGVTERTGFDGRVESPADREEVARAAERLVEAGCESIAIGFLHSHVNPDNERAAKDAVQLVAPDSYVVCSSEVLPVSGEFERFSTAVVSAYVGPSVSGYLTRLETALRQAGFAGSLLIVLSSGLMQSVERCHDRAAELLVSGPAAAPSAAIAAAAPTGHRHVLEVDMGGTSFEVCVIRDGVVPTTSEGFIGEERVATETVDVNSIGAGGGSIASIDSVGLLKVGPRSAGASPGPAAYGVGEEATVTDADLVLGLIPADFFLGGSVELDAGRSEAALRPIGERLGLDVDGTARAVFDMVNTSMANAVTEVCTKRGHDVRDFVMVAGGGAGGVHGASIAELLRVPTVVFSPGGPVLSAWGMLTTTVGQELSRVGVWDRLKVSGEQIGAVLTELAGEARASFADLGIAADRLSLSFTVSARYHGQFHEVRVPVQPGCGEAAPAIARIEEDFHTDYEALYGYALRWREIEILACHLRAAVDADGAREFQIAPGEASTDASPTPVGSRECSLASGRVEVPVYRRERLAPGSSFAGPALIDEPSTTIFVPSSFDAVVDEGLSVILTLRDADSTPPAAKQEVSVVHG